MGCEEHSVAAAVWALVQANSRGEGQLWCDAYSSIRTPLALSALASCTVMGSAPGLSSRSMRPTKALASALGAGAFLLALLLL